MIPAIAYEARSLILELDGLRGNRHRASSMTSPGVGSLARGVSPGLVVIVPAFSVGHC